MKMNHNHILLIDDDADDQLIFIDALGEIAVGIECAIAKNGLEAIEYLKTAIRTPSLIFLDLNMPLMNGFQCLEKIKKDERFKHLPVVVYTTSDDPIDKKRSKESGAEMFFSKTPNFKLLKDTLLEILKTNF
jgi:CheY-like chemotaxis protein